MVSLTCSPAHAMRSRLDGRHVRVLAGGRRVGSDRPHRRYLAWVGAIMGLHPSEPHRTYTESNQRWRLRVRVLGEGCKTVINANTRAQSTEMQKTGFPLRCRGLLVCHKRPGVTTWTRLLSSAGGSVWTRSSLEYLEYLDYLDVGRPDLPWRERPERLSP